MTTTIKLSIVGSSDEIENFMHAFEASQGDTNSCFSPLSCHEHLLMGYDDKSCTLDFNAPCPPSKDWIDNLRRKYPSFYISVVWSGTFVGTIGFIENDGAKYEVKDVSQLKEAVKMYEKSKCQCQYIYPRGLKRGQKCDRQATCDNLCDLCYEKFHPREDRRVIDCLKFDFTVDAIEEDKEGRMIYEEPEYNIAIILDWQDLPRVIGWYDENETIQQMDKEHLGYCRIFGL